MDGRWWLANLGGRPVKDTMREHVETNFRVRLFFWCKFKQILFASLCWCYSKLILGVSIVSKEVRDQTADFLMTKPVRRICILNAKILASITLLLTTWLFFSICMFAMLHLISSKEIDIEIFLLLCAAMFYIQIVLYSIGLMVSVVAKKIRAVLPVALGIGLFLYALSAFAVTSESDKLRYFTPYEYMKPEYIILNRGYEMSYVLCGIFLVVVSLTISYAVYIRRDIHAV